MTGQDIQEKLDSIVEDLQTVGRGQTVIASLRGTNNQLREFPLSSDAGGVVDAAQLSNLQKFIDDLKPIADTYVMELAPVSAASEAFNVQRATHQVLIDAASAARVALNDALEADEVYQQLKTALDEARMDAEYIAAREAYRVNNVSENFGNLGDAKGKYVV